MSIFGLTLSKVIIYNIVLGGSVSVHPVVRGCGTPCTQAGSSSGTGNGNEIGRAATTAGGGGSGSKPSSSPFGSSTTGRYNRFHPKHTSSFSFSSLAKFRGKLREDKSQVRGIKWMPYPELLIALGLGQKTTYQICIETFEHDRDLISLNIWRTETDEPGYLEGY